MGNSQESLCLPKSDNVLRNLCMNSKAYIKLDRKGENFPIERAVKQGDPVSRNIFNSVLKEVFWKMNWEKKRIKINRHWMSNLIFADDIVLISQNVQELRLMVEELCIECKKVGLKIINSITSGGEQYN